jgi:DNA-binding beta-propeller fold protein YncE
MEKLKMFAAGNDSRMRVKTISLMMLALVLAMPLLADKKDKGKQDTSTAGPPPPVVVDRKIDYRRLVWPPPPALPRVRYLDFFAAQTPQYIPGTEGAKKKQSWMDRMAGTETEKEKKGGYTDKPFQLLTPYGMAVDSKGMLYVADAKVGAVFIFNTENNDTTFIKHGVDGKFGMILGLAMDDDDHLYVSDGGLGHVLVYDANHKLLGGFGSGTLKNPNGLAIDSENRLLYVADTDLDQVVVFDADTFQLVRKMGTTGKNHTLTGVGDFAKPTNVAVDKDGNLYVSDTFNDRIQVFDADGNFIRTFGKNGDAPGEFARPKGVAIDCDGHVWVVDAMLNRIQVLTPEGVPLMTMGQFGLAPGSFRDPSGIAIDKKNRVFTSEQFTARVQMFRYITDAEARADLQKRTAVTNTIIEKKKAGEGDSAAPTAAPPAAPAAK